jgi:hypothetical protein
MLSSDHETAIVAVVQAQQSEDGADEPASINLL